MLLNELVPVHEDPILISSCKLISESWDLLQWILPASSPGLRYAQRVGVNGMENKGFTVKVENS